MDAFLKRMLVNELIDNFEINCYNDSDDFFITLVVLYDVLNADDLERIFRKTK